MTEVTFLLSPGEYDASFGDLEIPPGTRFDVVGNVDSRATGMNYFLTNLLDFGLLVT